MEKVLPLESEFRSIGISPNTKVSQCVKNLTQLLRENDKRPICLHTLPKLKGDITTDNSKKQKLEKPQTDALEGDKEEDIVEGDEIKLVKQIEKVIAKSRLNPSNNSIVKLISIVEIVKRQLSETGHPSFLESINDSKPKEQVRAEGKHNLTYGKENSRDMTNEDRGSSKSKNQDSIHKEKNEQVALHQYNQIDCLENLISIIMKDSQNKSNQVIDDDDGENKANNLINRKRKSIVENHNKKIIDEFLNQERKRPRQTHTPYMKIYISLNRIPSFENHHEISYQPLLLDSVKPNETSDKTNIARSDSLLVRSSTDSIENHESIQLDLGMDHSLNLAPV